jgi:hypothetical protein
MTEREQYNPAHLREWAPFHTDGRAPADMSKRFTNVRSLYG